MEKVYNVYFQYISDNNINREEKYNFSTWQILSTQQSVSEEILVLSTMIDKSEFNQEKQAKYYESLRWAIMSLCKVFLVTEDYVNYFKLIRKVLDIKNTNMTFIVKQIAKLISKIEMKRELFNELVLLIKEVILVCEKSNTVSLKNKLNIKLCEIYLINEEYKIGLDLINTTLVDLKRYEDNIGLIELQLIESKIHHKSKGLVKAKSALTTVKTLCTKVYIEPKLQAKIDMHAGVIASQEKDYNLGYSYFFESFDVYNLPQIKKPELAKKALLYMILTKIMSGKLDEINSIIYGKNQQKYYCKEVEALKEVEKSVKDKNVKSLREVVEQHKDLLNDFFIKTHLTTLHDELLEKNLKKIIEPYSVVEIDYITKSIGIQHNEILNKLSQMILDKKINGILDQGRNSLIIYEDSLSNVYLEKSLNVYKNLDKVVDSLFNKAKNSNL